MPAASARPTLSLGRRLDGLAERLRHRVVPNHWSSFFGVVAVSALLLLVVTGAVLMLLYDPSSTLVHYQGSYTLLRGVEVSRAFASILHLSLDVPGGLLVRQTHHWAALVLPAALLLQLLSTFFTGAFRRPRQWAWVLLVGVLVLTLVCGWSGYALPDDTLSGTGLRIVQGVTLAVPLVGTWLTWTLFGGELPGTVIPRLYLVHLVTPVLLAVLVALRLRLGWRTGPSQPPGPGRSEDVLVGLPVWPAGAVRAAGMFFLTSGVLVLLAGTLQVSPVWSYGPSSPGNAFAGSQPDWYTAFLDGALRLVPLGWEVFWWGRTWTLAVLVPLAAVGVFFVLLAGYPFLEGWVAADRGEHHLRERPRNTPTRTGIGAAGMTFYGALWLAGSADVLATQFRVSFEGVVWCLRVVVLLGPGAAFVLTRQVCRTLQAADRGRLLEGAESGRIEREPSGGYREPHQPLGAAQRWTLVQVERPGPLRRPAGGAPPLWRARARLHRGFFEDRPPLPPSSAPADDHAPGRPVAASPVPPGA